MANFARLLLGLLMLPLCWAVTQAFGDALLFVGGSENLFSAESLSLLAGVVVFGFCWATITHPIRAYVFGHELTHALWGLLFGARPSDVRVSASGGSVKLTRTNFLIVLAPYFFPFYTFLVIIAAIITYAFLRPLPCMPLWLFLIGFTWAFHVLFTLQTLTQRQPDVKLYGRIFSWVLIFLANILIVLLFLATMTHLTFAQTGGFLAHRIIAVYVGLGKWLWSGLCFLTSSIFHSST